MLIENSFEVPATIDVVWPYLLDVEKVVVCMPGAELTETIDETNWKGKVKVKLGPVSLSFAGRVTVVERDDEAHRVVLQGSGMEQRGKGRASATITTTAEGSGNGTLIKVVQDLQIQGQVASMSRGMMGDVSAKLTKQFAECLEANLSTDQKPEQTLPESAAVSSSPADAEGGAPVPSRPGQTAPSPSRPEQTTAPRRPTQPASSPARAEDVKAFSLLMGALGSALKRGLGRLFGRFKKRS